MTSTRRDHKQLWADPEFIRRLDMIKVKNGFRNKGEVTKRLVDMPEFEELLRKINQNNRQEIRMDRRRLLR